jgi:hypothetical protein
MAVAALARALLDHVPPVFGYRDFNEVANNYGDAGRSFKAQMEHLEKSSRNISDDLLHSPILFKETLPTQTQVNFSNDVDKLLGEIVRLLK